MYHLIANTINTMNRNSFSGLLRLAVPACILLFLASHTARAQQNSMDFFQDAGGWGVLSQVFDPHYKPDGTIGYYSLGNMLRLEPVADNEGKPVKTLIRFWDKHNHEWDTFQELRYIYAEGRLKEEQLWLCQSFTPKKNGPKLLSSNRHYFDPVSRIDSVVTYQYEDDSPQGYANIVTLRFLNREEQPDSVRVTYRFNLCLHRKDYMTYQQGKLVKIAHDNYSLAEKKLSGRSYTLLNESPTECTYTYNVDSLGRGGLQQRILLDKAGRITQVSLTADGGTPLLSAEYQYDALQRTSVRKTISLGKFHRLFELFNGNDIHYETTYTPGGEEVTTFYQKEGRGAMRKLVTSRISYNDRGEIATSEKESYEKSGAVGDREKIVKSYDGKGQLIQRLYYEWSKEKNDWWLNSKRTYAYDERGNETMKQHMQSTDGVGEQWYGHYYYEQTYDNANRMLSKLEHDFEDGKWVENQKTLWTYSPTGKLTSHQVLFWNRAEGWAGDTYYTLSYDANDSLQSKVDYKYQVLDSSLPMEEQKHDWRPHKANEYRYLPNSREAVYYTWEEGVKTPRSLSATYAANDSVCNSKFRWDNPTKQWIPIEREIEYNRNGYTTIESYEENDAGVFVGIIKKEEEKRKIDGADYERRATYHWDLERNTWVPYEQTKLTQTASQFRYTLEEYDKAAGTWVEAERVANTPQQDGSYRELHERFDKATGKWVPVDESFESRLP